MSKKSNIIKNWPRYLLQWGVLAALVIVLTGIIPGKEPADPEAYCPVGGLQALTTFFVNGSLPCSMSSLQIMMGIMLAAAVVLFSKLFCGYLCPLGTVQDLLAKARKGLGIKAVTVRNGSVADSVLRIFKYGLVFWIFYMTATASELFCKNLDPYYAVATGFQGEITLWMSVVTLVLLILGGFFVNMFWCRYLCPLGAISNSLKFWIWIGALFVFWWILSLLGADIPWWILLALFCIMGYLLEIFNRKPKYQILNVIKDGAACTHCGICNRNCPYGIDVDSLQGGRLDSVDCTLCGECVASCPTSALSVGVCKNRRNSFGKYLPAILTVVFFIIGVWIGNRFELPTIDETWGIEEVAEDGSVTMLVNPDNLAETRIDGLKSVKCYGSSMAFKARLQKIPGIYGVKTFVNHHYAIVTYDPSAITPEKILERIYVPSKFRVNTPDPALTDSVKVLTIRTEKMYDKLDLNYLGLQMRLSGKKIYGLTSEFACPLIVHVYADPSEDLDKDWFREIVEMKTLSMPVHGGGTKDTEVDYEFVAMEDTVSYMPVEDLIRMLFTPFKAEFRSRVEQYEGQPQFIYEVADPNYEKPIILRNMPYLSNHLSGNEGIIGIYLDLNDALMPAIRIRYAAPMTEDELWKLMTMDTWTITYSKDDVRETPAKLSFDKKGVVKPVE